VLKTCVGNLCWFVDVLDTPDSLKLLDLLESVDVQQHVTQPTHVHRHTLNLIIPQHSDQIVQDPPQTDHYFLDHASLRCKPFHDEPVVTSPVLEISACPLTKVSVKSVRRVQIIDHSPQFSFFHKLKY